MPRKTDSEIEQWVLRELSLSEKVLSAEICVLARDGVVRLRGTAHNYQDNVTIETATRRAAGVVGVVNEMKLKPCTALIENAVAKSPLTEPLSPGVLAQPIATQPLMINARTG